MTPEQQAEMLRNLLMAKGLPTTPQPGMEAPPPQPPAAPAQGNPYQAMGPEVDPMERAANLAEQKENFRLEQLKLAQKMAGLAGPNNVGPEGSLGTSGNGTDDLVKKLMSFLPGN